METEGISLERYPVRASKTAKTALLAILNNASLDIPWGIFPPVRKSTLYFLAETTEGVPESLLGQIPQENQKEPQKGPIWEYHSKQYLLARKPFEDAYAWAVENGFAKRIGLDGTECTCITEDGRGYLSEYFFRYSPPDFSIIQVSSPEAEEPQKRKKWKEFSEAFNKAARKAFLAQSGERRHEPVRQSIQLKKRPAA